MAPEDRSLHLLWISLCSMGLLAITVLFVAESWLLGAVVIAPVVFLFGCVVGLPSAPFVMLCLMKKRLRYSWPFVYVPTFAATITYESLLGIRGTPLITLLLAIGMVAVMSVIGYFVLPNVRPASEKKDECDKCGYSRRGLPYGHACPECGTMPWP